ncbi:YidC/Oxa1 family membrane protein insertase [Desulfuribacillus alkaliarsenatis]|uniref:Preprotein translocase YidC n=1 Tax=Desulfuribacillus alkaliarsenatis TaxID=766136 RepID=A0A1E5G3E1_9FIRM|nr:preprotein translocase YidC [Desulfuribacillus alkaliarsenatis]
MSKKIIILFLVLALTVFISGCSIEEMQNRDLSESTGLWWSFVKLLSTLMDDIEDVIGSYGISILIVTVLIRFIVLPFMIKQIKSMRAMQKLQPEMNKIKEKYKNNQEKLNQETMKLFQTHNVNPLAGCLPLLIQMPILIAFYQAIMYNPDIREASFLYLQLGERDPFYIIPILAAATTYWQQKTMSINMDNPQTKMLLYLMPAMILFISATLPSALGLYWVYSNLFSVVQNHFLYRDKDGQQEGKK